MGGPRNKWMSEWMNKWSGSHVISGRMLPETRLICTLSHHVPSQDSPHGAPALIPLIPALVSLPIQPTQIERRIITPVDAMTLTIKISGSITLGKSVTPLGPSVSHEPWPLGWMPVWFVWVSLLSNQDQSCPWSGHSAPVGAPGRSCVKLGSSEKQDRQGL